MRTNIDQDAAVFFLLKKPIGPRMKANAVRSQPDGLHHPPNRPGLHQFAGFHRGAHLKALAEANRIDAAGLGLRLPDSGQLRQAGETGLIGHIVFAVLHHAQPKRCALAGNPGADHELDALIFQDFFLAARAARLWKLAGKPQRQIVFGRKEGDKFCPGAQQQAGLAVDVVVVDADHGEPNIGLWIHPNLPD